MGLIGSLTGSDAKKALDQSKALSDKALKKGYDEGLVDYNSGVDTLRPAADSGNANRKMYDDLIGINGPEARAKAQELVASDPQFQGQLMQSSNALLRGLVAQGASSGGKAQIAAQRNLQQNWGGWLDRYGANAQNGQNATNALASGLASRGDYKYGYGATKAGNEITFGNAKAANAGTFGQNFIAGAGIVAQAMKPTPGLPTG